MRLDEILSRDKLDFIREVNIPGGCSANKQVYVPANADRVNGVNHRVGYVFGLCEAFYHNPPSGCSDDRPILKQLDRRVEIYES